MDSSQGGLKPCQSVANCTFLPSNVCKEGVKVARHGFLTENLKKTKAYCRNSRLFFQMMAMQTIQSFKQHFDIIHYK